MSVTVYWQPIKPIWLKGCMSSTVDALEKVFGEMPITLHNDEKTMNQLLAMEATYNTGDANPYKQLSDALIEHNSIMITTQY